MEEVIKEGRWRCPNCGALNRGRDVKCPGCGQARENVEFEYDEAAPAVTAAEELAVARGGADWVCAFCGTSNRAGHPACRQCSAAAADGAARQVRDLPLGPETPAPAVAPSSPWPRRLVLGFFGLMFLLGWFGSCESNRQVTLEAASWTRTIEVEKQLPVTEEGWQLPSEARELSRTQAVHHHVSVPIGTRPVTKVSHEKVKVGTKKQKTGVKDMGNGYFKEIYEEVPVYEQRRREHVVQETVYRKDPVYQTRYTYEVMKWKTVRTERAGDEGTSPVWPDPRLGEGEREGKRTETCRCVFKDESKGEKHDLDLDAATFMTLKVGDRVPGVFNGFGKLLRLEKPQQP
jgi:hypothetical protein